MTQQHVITKLCKDQWTLTVSSALSTVGSAGAFLARLADSPAVSASLELPLLALLPPVCLTALPCTQYVHLLFPALPCTVGGNT